MPRGFRTDHEVLGETDATADLVLGAPALLGIFFAAALLCAVCFGFGYSSGHTPRVTPLVESDETASAPQAQTPPRASAYTPAGRMPNTTDAANAAADATSPQDGAEDTEPGFPPAQDGASSASKPAPGMRYASPDTPPPGLASAETQDLPASRRAQTSQSAKTGSTPYAATRRPAAGAPENEADAIGTPAPTAVAPVPVAPRIVGAPNAEPVTASAGAALNLMVQIAAVSHAADAETLASALRHDGFAAIVRTTTGDPYFHVQIGPFASMQAAKTMRAKLAGNGYNAFIRP